MASEEILFVTGLSMSPKLNQAHAWLSFHQYLISELFPSLPKLETGELAVSVRWAVHYGPDGAGISRRYAALNTDKDLIFNFDADDFLGPTSLRDRYCIMMSHPNIDLLLTSVSFWMSQSSSPGPGLSESSPPTSSPIRETLEDLVAGFDLLRTYRSQYLGSEESEVSDRLINMNSSAWIENFTKGLDGWYFLSSPMIRPGSLVDLPLLENVNDCEGILKNILKIEFQMEGSYDLKAELESYSYLHSKCLKQKTTTINDSAGFVRKCGNGWNVIRTNVMRSLPATLLPFGEDALLNFVASKYGFQLICYPDLSAGLYNLIVTNNTSSIHLDSL